MLFANQVQSINDRVSAIQDNIDQLELMLIELRSDKTQLEAELQQILTLESAGESALNQCQQFLLAVRSIGRADLEATFWEGIAQLQGDRPLLPPIEIMPSPDLDIDPEPIVDTPPENPDQTTEVELVDTDRMIVDTPPENPDQTDRMIVDSEMPSEDNSELENMTVQALRRLARSRGVSLRGRRTHTQIVQALKAA